LLMEYLKPYGFSLDEATDGFEALQKMHEKDYDLVLMDIPMPNMNGWETIHAIRNELNNHTVSVIAVSASIMKHETEKILNAFDGLIEKPVNKKQLISILKSFLNYSVQSPQQIDQKSDFKQFDINVLNYLKKSLLRKCQESTEVCNSGDMDKIGLFVNELEEIGKTAGFKPLKDYVTELKNAVDSFDIEKAEYLLKNFCRIKDTWDMK